MSFSLEKQIVWVTGASRGLGKEIALTLARQGACVVGTATTEEGAAGISAEFSAQQLLGSGKVLDVTNTEQVEACFSAIKQEYGAPTILINNAGITRDNLLLRMKDKEWQEVINTNLNAVFKVTQVCLKDMLKARSGRIIMISSIVGKTGNPGQANYAAAKAGVIGFSKSLALEVATRGITVNVIAPGFIETDMTDNLSEVQKTELMRRIPCQRLGRVQDIAYACTFLASPAASYITGQTLHVNGGMTME